MSKSGRCFGDGHAAAEIGSETKLGGCFETRYVVGNGILAEKVSERGDEEIRS